jgi:hypothetical protein
METKLYYCILLYLNLSTQHFHILFTHSILKKKYVVFSLPPSLFYFFYPFYFLIVLNLVYIYHIYYIIKIHI